MMNESFSSNDFDSLDTRSFRKGALATIKSASALDKTVKSCYLVMSQRQYESPRVRRKYRANNQTSSLDQPSSLYSSALDDSVNNLHLSEQPSTLAELAALSQKQQSFPVARSNDVSANVIKEAMIKRLREHDSLKRQYVKGELAFTDSITSMSEDPNKHQNNSYADLTHNSKLSSLVSSRQDYAFKWQKMREMRTKRRIEKESLEQQRSSATLFRTIVKHMEKESHSEQLNQRRQELAQATLQTGYKNKTRHTTAHQLFTLKQEREHQKKRQEIAEMKALTQSNIDFVKSQIEEERSIIRLQRPDSFGDLGALSPRSEASSASSTSFLIKVPDEMRDRVKKAKSLLQYTAAKREIKDFQEQVYSEKLRSIAIRKHLARQLSKGSGSQLHYNQIDGTEYFSDDSKEMNKLRSVMSFDDTINSDLDDHSIQLSVK